MFTKSFLTSLMAMAPCAATIIEQGTPDAITRYGLMGVVLGWFMFRADKRLAGIEHKMGGLNRTMLIEILSRPGVSEQAKRMGREELRKVAPELADEMDQRT